MIKVKVQWNHFGHDEVVWELEVEMKEAYTFFFLISNYTKANAIPRGRGM
jgi:hypothetical protein